MPSGMDTCFYCYFTKILLELLHFPGFLYNLLNGNVLTLHFSIGYQGWLFSFRPNSLACAGYAVTSQFVLCKLCFLICKLFYLNNIWKQRESYFVVLKYNYCFWSCNFLRVFDVKKLVCQCNF